jgi:hypothetical protein
MTTGRVPDDLGAGNDEAVALASPKTERQRSVRPCDVVRSQSMRGSRSQFRLLVTALSRPLSHFLVRSVRRATGHAAHDRAKEAVTMVKMARNPANDCASNAAFGGGSAWGHCDREDQE